MKALFLGANSHVARLLLKSNSWSHVLLHSQYLSQLHSLTLSLPRGVQVELFPCDFEKVHEDALIEFNERLKRLGSLDAIVLTAGSWNSYARFAHLSLEELYMAWQVNYFYPLSLLKMALPLMRPGAKVFFWALDTTVRKQPLWTSIFPIMVAWEELLTQLACEQEWFLERIETGFVRSAQSLKLFPSGAHCAEHLELHSQLFEA